MKIGYLGAGSWGTAVANMLACNGHEVIVWDRNKPVLEHLRKKRVHPKMPDFPLFENIRYVENIEDAVLGADFLFESITSSGIRTVFKELYEKSLLKCPIVITSKGIEQKTGLLFPEILLEIIGEKNKHLIGCLTGPNLAFEVMQQLPSASVSSSYDPTLMMEIADLFKSSFFRVYPNSDLMGICFGGAMKNIIAIACGISDGLKFGNNTKAALMTRGLHEIKKLSKTKNANPETLNGLAGLGDLFVTCVSSLSRNYRFGKMLAEGVLPEKAKEDIGMVVEGAYTVVSARELSVEYHIPAPITQATYSVLYEGLAPENAVKLLLQRAVKEELL